MPLPRIIIEKPPAVAPRYGLLTAAYVIDVTDPHAAAGFQWQPDFCGHPKRTLAACYTSTEEWSISVDASGEATVSPSIPVGTYVIDWGDGDSDTVDWNDLPWVHTYEPGEYEVTITSGGNQFSALPVTVTVDDGEDTGPFDFDVTFVASKTIDSGRDLAHSVETTLYVLTECSPVGNTDQEQYTRSALTRGEDAPIAGLLIDAVAEDDDLIVLGADDGWSPTYALAEVQQALADVYAGAGVIHMSPKLATYLFTAGALVQDGMVLRTGLGTPVAVSPSYDGVVPDAGGGAEDDYIWATGTVIVQRSQISVYPQVPTQGAAGGMTNDFLYLGERPVAVGWECTSIAAGTTIPTTNGGAGGGVDGGTP